MPYLDRDSILRVDTTGVLEAPGDLNWLVTRACIQYAEDRNLTNLNEKIDRYVSSYCNQLGDSYTTYNNVVGAIVCCGLEFERRSDRIARIASDRSALTEVSAALKEWVASFYEGTVTPYECDKLECNGDVYP